MKLQRSNEKVFAGVLGGFAEYLGWDKTLVRLGYSAITLFTMFMPGIIFYFVAAIVMPDSEN
ncbi:PspC domain-containing protein [Paucilactobacillus wasatchensis]|uniref:Stress-responsive transcriptional regulator PspC n=1 Tax=Paucilactobacillus wasatchensis TaxID=1335616 RepID=A0A0D0Y3G8_9LACO|nr:PspC domain-containing protein [Paucilactobacillus wasatchensis]KIS02798.1 Stress-responsive transcriptional regulator PspC [Paucilactobacillus wasatchensis]